MKVDILAVGVHPDDIELSCSGTLLSHIAQGYSVGLCDLTQGELGTRGNKTIRLAEAEMARLKMGAKFRVNLGLEDGFMQVTKENTLRLIKIIRQSKPKILLANAVEDRHPDHGRAAKFIADAAFYSGLQKIKTKSDEGHELAAHRPDVVYHYVQDRQIRHDFLVDISDFFDQKLDLILTFKSQFYSEKKGEDGPQTPISSKYFMEYMKSKNQVYGRDIGAQYAEAFTVNRGIGVKNLFHLR